MAQIHLLIDHSLLEIEFEQLFRRGEQKPQYNLIGGSTMAVIKKTTVSERPASPRGAEDAIKLTLWFIKEMGGAEKAKTAIEAIIDFKTKMGMLPEAAAE